MRSVEWPTVALVALGYGAFAVGTAVLPLWPGIIVTTLALTLYSSLQHEVLHGHPFANQRLNDALVFPALNVAVPYLRFRDTHLAHHRDARLTDPYDDPESNYLDPQVWTRLPLWLRVILRFNNTLMGRITVGPLIGQVVFLRAELKTPGVGLAWGLWALGLIPVIWWFASVATQPAWAFALATYASNGLLRIRTFLEHRAHERSRARSVVIEDRGLFALLFLNNNYHVVHHMHPGVAWYKLPALYRASRDRYLACNEGYVYRNYFEIFRAHFLRAKDPVAHPLWQPPARGDIRGE